MTVLTPPPGSSVGALTRLSLWVLAVGAVIGVLAVVASRVGIQVFIPTVDEQTITTAPTAKIGDRGGLAFRVDGDQRPGCVVRNARFLRYRDTNTLVPVSDVSLPNVAVANSKDRDVDQSNDSHYVSAHFILPLPKSYVLPGVARLEIQSDDIPCGYLHGFLPAHIRHWVSRNWTTILPAEKGD